MLVYASSAAAGSANGRALRGLALVGAILSVVLLARPSSAAPRGQAPAFAGTWKATDAVDDNERAWVVQIKRIGDDYEFLDPSVHPQLVLRGISLRRKVVFVQKGKHGMTVYTFTLSRDVRSLTGDRQQGGSHLGYHFVRASRSHRSPHNRRHH